MTGASPARSPSRRTKRARPAGAGPLGRLGVLLSLLLTLAGCTGSGGSASFEFVSPGGKTEFSYPAADRKPIGSLAGPAMAASGADQATIDVGRDYAGKVVVLNFWGSWCPPCRAEAPQLQDASVELAPKGVQFLGLDVQDSRGDGAAFAAAKKITYPSIFDPSMRTLLSINGYPANGIPSTIVLDRQHRVAHLWIGSITRAELVSVVAPIASEA